MKESKPRHLITIRDLNGLQVLDLFRVARRLKKGGPGQQKPLVGKTLGLLFQKPSVRTRVSFEVGMAHLGGQSLYIGPVEIQEGQREASKDVARVLSRYLDGIVARTFKHKDVEEMARFSSIPVINGLSDDSHPCQALSDLFTIQERFGGFKGIRVAYVGDGNNVCHSLMEVSALLGVELAVATPERYQPDPKVVRWALSKMKGSRGRILLGHNPKEAVRGALVVYTDVWTSMGQERQRKQRKQDFKRFQVNLHLMHEAENKAVFMHCLPAHRGEEVTDEVMDSRCSIVYDQAENRLHVQKAVLLMLLGS